MEKRWWKRGGGQQQSLMLPWKHVYASLMHLVDPIRGRLCLHRHMHVHSAVVHARACMRGFLCARARAYVCLCAHTLTQNIKSRLLLNHNLVGVRTKGLELPRPLLSPSRLLLLATMTTLQTIAWKLHVTNFPGCHDSSYMDGASLTSSILTVQTNFTFFVSLLIYSVLFLSKKNGHEC